MDLITLDATAVKQAWTYDSLLVMLSKWGGIAAFCMLIFGGAASYWNYFFFFKQVCFATRSSSGQKRPVGIFPAIVSEY